MGDAVSVKDVAALAGVSVGTVSNVLNRPVTGKLQVKLGQLQTNVVEQTLPLAAGETSYGMPRPNCRFPRQTARRAQPAQAAAEPLFTS